MRPTDQDLGSGRAAGRTEEMLSGKRVWEVEIKSGYGTKIKLAAGLE